MLRPYLAGSGWRALFTPAKTGCYVNDHCVIQDHAGRWHVFGITKATPQIDPHNERWFCHGSGASLAGGEWREHVRACDFGTRAWAPTIAFDGRQWVMLYGPDVLRAAICDDPRLESWHEASCSLVGAAPFAIMRDGMVMRLDDRSWLLYATAKCDGAGAISVSISENLRDWRFVRFVLRTTAEAPKQPPWSATESPFVFRHDGAYWLSLTYTGSGAGPADYHETLLFRSANPFDFGTYGGDPGQAAAKIAAHAPEYLFDAAANQWYVTSAGWHGAPFGTVLPGSVAIRELDWRP